MSLFFNRRTDNEAGNALARLLDDICVSHVADDGSVQEFRLMALLDEVIADGTLAYTPPGKEKP